MFHAPSVFLSMALALTAVGTLPSCASNRSYLNDAQLMSQSLQGTWLLQSYHPSVAMELPLQGLLNAQIGMLQVAVNGSAMTANGPGISVSRTLLIQEVVDGKATALITEPTGVSLQLWLEFHDAGKSLTFRTLDAPWTGEGMLRRL